MSKHVEDVPHTIEALFGGGVEIDFVSEPFSNILTVKVLVNDDHPGNFVTQHKGSLHVDASEVRDLRNALDKWLERQAK